MGVTQLGPWSQGAWCGLGAELVSHGPLSSNTGKSPSAGLYGSVMNAFSLTKVVRVLAGSVMLAGLAACGGGHDDVGPAPEVSLRVSTSVAERGEPIQLRASAYASNGMDHVRFYRLDYNGPFLLGTVWAPPPNLATSVPINAGASVSFFARACDLEGLCTDSNVATVTVYP